MDESTEELKANMEKAFAERVEADQKLTALADHLNSGKGTYVTAEQYAYETGKVLSGIFREQITEEKLPEGVFTREFVQETIEPLLKDDHKIVSTMAAVAQENINTAAGVHIQPQKADFNQNRADGFATKMEGKTMEEAGWMLGSPVTNFSQSVVDETMIKNGEVLAKAGNAATIKRQAEAKCCDWCLNKAGTYDATNREAYQRHRDCRCEIEMHLDGSVKRQEDWKKNQWAEQKEKIAKNIENNIENDYAKNTSYGKIIIDGDVFVPCLLETSTGKLVETVVEEVNRKSLKGYNKQTGWYTNWSTLDKNVRIFKLTVKGDDEIQGLLGITPNDGYKAVYLNWAVAAPHNNPIKLNGRPKKYEGVGGHLMAIAAQVSAEYGYGGAAYGFAANKDLLKYYIEKFGAEYLPVEHPYEVFYSEEAMKRFLEMYNYEWK